MSDVSEAAEFFIIRGEKHLVIAADTEPVRMAQNETTPPTALKVP